jgi:hypothetical protein
LSGRFVHFVTSQGKVNEHVLMHFSGRTFDWIPLSFYSKLHPLTPVHSMFNLGQLGFLPWPFKKVAFSVFQPLAENSASSFWAGQWWFNKCPSVTSFSPRR